jgi:hypothetical protein
MNVDDENKSGLDIKFKSVAIQNFRGVSQTLRIEFVNTRSLPVSFLVIGDNGSGKSTVVDALEFAAQGAISRSQKFTSKYVPSVISCHSQAECEVSVELSNNELIQRRATMSRNTHVVVDKVPHPAFLHSPLVLRRTDITRFWDVTDEERQTLFFHYFKSHLMSSKLLGITESERETKSQIAELKLQRLQRLFHLAESISPEAVQDVPRVFATDALARWKKMHIRGDAGIDKTRLTAIRNEMRSISLLGQQISHLKREITETRAVLPHSDLQYHTSNALLRIGSFITKTFLALSPTSNFVENITVQIGSLSRVSLEFVVHLKNGKKVFPLQIFSEANLDLLALIVHVGICREVSLTSKSKVIVLDDVMQSMDGVTRLRTTEYLFTEFREWQFILTVNDRMWAEQLQTSLRRQNIEFGVAEIRRWTHVSGPQLVPQARYLYTALLAVLENGEVHQICAEAGLLLERVSNQLSVIFPISVTRRKDDKYTLGDLWPGCYKVLKRTAVASVADEVDRWVHLRNLVGAHYNEWATSLSHTEADAFGQAVINLTKQVWCESCRLWIASTGKSLNNRVWSCRCGVTKLSIQ